MTRGPLDYFGRLAGGTIAALVFFTRAPVARWYRATPGAAQDAMVYAPLVGVVLGGIAAVLAHALAMALPPLLASALTVAAVVMATGALHEDALADCCDGFGAGGEPARIIEIMRDPRCGSFGVAGLSLVLLIQVLGVAALLERAGLWPLMLVLALASGGSRFVATALMAFMPRVSADGSKLGSSGDPLVRAALLWSGLPVAFVCVALLRAEPPLLLAVLVLPVVAWWLARRFGAVLGGYTGDCLGAVIKLGEVACLVTATALAG